MVEFPGLLLVAVVESQWIFAGDAEERSRIQIQRIGTSLSVLVSATRRGEPFSASHEKSSGNHLSRRMLLMSLQSGDALFVSASTWKCLCSRVSRGT